MVQQPFFIRKNESVACSIFFQSHNQEFDNTHLNWQHLKIIGFATQIILLLEKFLLTLRHMWYATIFLCYLCYHDGSRCPGLKLVHLTFVRMQIVILMAKHYTVVTPLH